MRTKLEESLIRAKPLAESDAVDRIVIVSDMAPDHQKKSKLWHFDRKDLLDLKNTLDILENWAAKNEVFIYLLGWEKPPGFYTEDELKELPSEIEATLNLAKYMPIIKDRKLNKRLVEKGNTEINFYKLDFAYRHWRYSVLSQKMNTLGNG